MLTPCDGIQLMPDGQTPPKTEKRRYKDDASQEQDGRDNRGDGPSSKDKPQPTGLRLIEKPLAPPAAPVESIGRHAAENCNRQNRWNVHNGANPPNDQAERPAPVPERGKHNQCSNDHDG